MRNGIISSIIFLVVIFSHADEVLLTGSVYKSDGTGIAGAQIRLKKLTHFFTLTDASGAFELKGNTPISYYPTNLPRSPKIFIQGKYLIVNADAVQGKLKVEIFNSRGIKVFSHIFRNSSSDKYSIPLTHIRAAQGLYLVRLTSAKATHVLKMVISGSRYLSGTVASTNPGNNNVIGKAKTFQVIDTLIVVAQNYQHKLIDIENYIQDNINCTLNVSNPWIPTGALEYDKGMVKIIATGHNFEMGQPDPNIWGPNTSSREQPVHTVSFTYDFWMDTVEVTQADYDTLMKSTYPDYANPVWMEPYGVGDSLPTYSILWGDAALYCNARSKRDSYDTVYSYDSIAGEPGYMAELIGLIIDLSKNGYRLPTEAEWEYACRGGTATDYYWGKNHDPYPATAADSTEIGEYSVWTVNSWDLVTSDDFGIFPVAAKTPNAYGLYDVSGNLSEWCNDWDDLYNWGSEVDPTGPATGQFNVLRGGNWGNNASYVRSVNRYFFNPDYMYYFIGFRAAQRVQ